MSEFIAPLLNISTEGGLQREIKDVIDELEIMISIYMQQITVMKKFVNNVVDLLKSTSSKESGKNNLSTASPDPNTYTPASSPPKDDQSAVPSHPITSTAVSSTPNQREADHNEKRPQKHKLFSRKAQELLDDVEERFAELKRLKRSAESTSHSVSLPTTWRRAIASCPCLLRTIDITIADCMSSWMPL